MRKKDREREEKISLKVKRAAETLERASRASVFIALSAAIAYAAPPVAGAEPPRVPSKQKSSVSSVDTLVTAAHVLTMDGSDRVYSPGAVAVKGGRIVAVGTPSDLLSLYSPKQRESLVPVRPCFRGSSTRTRTPP